MRKRTSAVKIKRRGKGGKLLKLLATIVLVYGCVFAVWWLWRTFKTHPAFRVEKIEVKGYRYGDIETVRRLVDSFKGEGIFTVDMGEVIEEITSDPWIRSCSIERRIPGTLVIKIREEVPALFLEIPPSVYLVSEEGAIIPDYPGALSKLPLPLVTGAGPAGGSSMEGCINLSLELSKAIPPLKEEEVIKRLDFSNPSEILLYGSEKAGIVKLSRKEPLRNLREYLSVKKFLTHRFGEMEYVDLRWDGKIFFRPLIR